MPRLRERCPDLQLVVIGGEAELALRRGGRGETQRLREAVARHGLGDAVHLLGVVPTAVLVAALQRAQAFVFPVLDIPGDVEGFGAVALEAAASGCPTVAFAVGGVPDAVRDGVSGRLIAAGDYAGMVDALAELVALPTQARAQWGAEAKRFAAGFTWAQFGEQMRAQVRRLAQAAA
jgi:phosphatidylinositol alpha-1,6-mannosyltransferase